MTCQEDRLTICGPFYKGGAGAPPYAPNGLLALRGMTIEKLAQKSGLTRTIIYNYLAGKHRPTAKNLRLICDALHVRFDRALEYCTPATMGRPPWELGTVLRPTQENILTECSSVVAPSITDDESTSAPQGTEGAFALELLRLMNEHDPPLDMRNLSVALGSSYEHVRKLCRGLTLPSKTMTFAIARHFGVLQDALHSIVKKDRFTKEFGNELPCQLRTRI